MTSSTMTDQRYEYIDARTIRDPEGMEHDVLEAIGQLPWVRQLCPFMPHEYAILSRSPEHPWYVVEAMIRLSPTSYRTFFRGYPRANRYWEAPDGRRYWRSRFELDRWDASDVSGLRRRDEGAHPIKDWDGPPWATNASGYYIPGPKGKWWPSAKFFVDGYEPCRACRNPPAKLRSGPRHQ
jgi:hypothetical protein